MLTLKEFQRHFAIEPNVLGEKETGRLHEYMELLALWNEKINLTAITDDGGVIIKHFQDSLTVLPFIPENAPVIDVGTGAGFPGMPLAVARGDIHVTLLDSLNKRTRFLEHVKDKLSLGNVRVVCDRAEDAGRDAELRERFGVAVSRAVAPLVVLSEYCLPFVKVGGVFVAMKGGDVLTEAEEAEYAIRELGGMVKSVNSFELAGNKRTIIEIAKAAQTPEKYPRRAGMPAKKPLRGTVEICN